MNAHRVGKWTSAVTIAAVAAIILTSAHANEPIAGDGAPVVLAQASTSARATTASGNASPVLHYEAAARAAAAEGPDALRRYIHRTRMIYALYYYDYAAP